MEQQLVSPTIDDFLRDHPCEMEVKRTGPQPTYRPPGQMFDFECEIIEHARNPRQTVRQAITVAYHMGIGLGLRPAFAYDKSWRDGVWRNAMGDPIPPKWPTPDIRDVIDCLRSDALCIDNGETFIEFAREMGYESLEQYEEARKAYDGCHEALAKLRRLFGRDGAEKLMYEVEGR